MMDIPWQDWLLPTAGILAGWLVVLLFWCIWLTARLRRLHRLLRKLLPLGESQPLDILLERMLSKQEQTYMEVIALVQKVDMLNLLLQGCLQRVGIVRFDAFNDTAGQQSFALALLDNRGNGIVITSLFGRTESRSYAKPIVHGTSKYRLSEEEEAAIRQALEQPIGHQRGEISNARSG